MANGSDAPKLLGNGFWSIDLRTILLLMGMLGSVIGFYTAINVRLAVLETKMSGMESKISEVSQDVKGHLQATHSQWPERR